MHIISRFQGRVIDLSPIWSRYVDPQTGIVSVGLSSFQDRCLSKDHSTGLGNGSISCTLEFRPSKGRIRIFMSSNTPEELTKWLYPVTLCPPQYGAVAIAHAMTFKVPICQKTLWDKLDGSRTAQFPDMEVRALCRRKELLNDAFPVGPHWPPISPVLVLYQRQPEDLS